MHTKNASLACLVALVFALPAPRAALAQWPVNGVPLSSWGWLGIDGVQLFPDGSGGVLSAWHAYGGGDHQIHATRVTSIGSIAANWPADGVLLGSVKDGAASPDGAGGITVAASIYGDDEYAWHLLPDGTGQWNGAVTTTPQHEFGARIIGDGTGGWYVAWIQDYAKVYLQHIQSNGVRYAGWPAAGFVVAAPGMFPGISGSPALALDGSGGALLLWKSDFAYAQHVTASATLDPAWPPNGVVLGDGTPEPDGLLGILPSGAGYFIAAWQTMSRQVLLLRMGLDGSQDGSWPAGGLVAVNSASQAVVARAIPDGGDGVLLAWTLGGTNANGVRYGPDGSRISGWPYSGVPLSSGSVGDWAITNGGGAGRLIFAWNAPNPDHGHVKWFLGDGTVDPSQPAGGRLVHSTDPGVNIRGLLPDGIGGAYVAWARLDTLYWRNTLMLSRVTYPTPLAVGPPVDGRTLDLQILGANPSRGDFALRYTLASGAPARLELLDLSGRRLREVALEGAGTRSARFDETGSLRPGLYLVRLTQAAHSRTARIAIVR